MRCKILRASDDYVLNIRHTDEIIEQYGLDDAQADLMEANLKSQGRYWLDADTIVVPVRS